MKTPRTPRFQRHGLSGDNISPHGVGRRSCRNQKLCRDLLRPGRADRLGLVALGCGEPARRHARAAAGFRFRPVALPEGAIQTRTDFGKAGYGGAAPPKNRYISSRSTRWMWRRLRSMKARAARWSGLTCISIPWGARRLRRCIPEKAGWRLRLTRPGSRIRRPGKRSAAGQNITAPKVAVLQGVPLPEAASPYQYPAQRSGHHRNA